MERPAGKFVYIIATEDNCLTLFGTEEITRTLIDEACIVDYHSQASLQLHQSCPRSRRHNQAGSVKLG